MHLRHRNGGGLILDIDSGIGDDCYLSRDSHIEQRSIVSYKSSVSNSALRASAVSASEIDSSVLIDSHVAGASVLDSVLENVIVRGNGRKAIVDEVILSKVVAEGCKLQGFELHGPYFIHSNWDGRPPRHRLLEFGHSVIGLSECYDDHFHVACECRSFSEWDKKEYLLRRYFLRQGWPEDMFDSIRKTFEQWR